MLYFFLYSGTLKISKKMSSYYQAEQMLNESSWETLMKYDQYPVSIQVDTIQQRDFLEMIFPEISDFTILQS